MTQLHAVIMAGGSGTRFWPASRQKRPKQFLPLAHGVPLIQATVDRLRGLVDPDRIWIVTNRTQARPMQKLLRDFPAGRIIVEPEARDTAPCVALSVAHIAAREPDATLITLPADHVITPTDDFQHLLRRGAELASDQRTLVTFGIAPTFPATGYGYIETGEPLDQGEPKAFRAVRFREKPDLATAEQFVQSGRFLWNSGIFVWSVTAIRAAMAHGSPELAAACEAMTTALHNPDFAARARSCNAAFRRAPKKSVDYAVMEHARHVAVIRADVRWDDVGAFTALGAVAPTDALGNVALGIDGASHVACESRDNIVYAEGKRTVALFGVRDLVVVAVGDAVLVCPKDRAADLKVLVEQVKAEGRKDLL